MKNYKVANPLERMMFTATTQSTAAPMLESNDNDQPKKFSAEDIMMEAVSARAGADLRALAASMIAQWIDDGEDGADADSFDALALSMAGIDSIEDDDDLDDDQVDEYNDALAALAEAAVAMGADQDDVTDMIDDWDDAAATRVFESVSENDSEMMESAIVMHTITGGDEPMLEAVRKKVVRNGKVKIIRKRPRPRRLNSLQKQALKKARRRAHTSVAKLHRKKSMRLRQKRGL